MSITERCKTNHTLSVSVKTLPVFSSDKNQELQVEDWVDKRLAVNYDVNVSVRKCYVKRLFEDLGIFSRKKKARMDHAKTPKMGERGEG
jgi:hypothetical protein